MRERRRKEQSARDTIIQSTTRYKKECGKCITRPATPKELSGNYPKSKNNGFVISAVRGPMFELDPNRAEEFFEKADKSACQRAIDRARKHRPATLVKEKDDVMSGEDKHE